MRGIRLRPSRDVPMHPSTLTSSEAMEPTPSHPSRRQFAKTIAAAAVLPLVAGVQGCAPGVPSPAPAPAPSPAPPTGAGAPAAAAAPTPPDPVAQALTEAVRVRYGSRLTPADMEEVRKGIEGNLQAAKAIRAFPLPISTEPAFVFRAYRGAGR